MIFYDFFNFGLILILSGFFLNFIAKKFYRILVPILMILSFLIPYSINIKWNIYLYEQSLFSNKYITLILASIFFLVLFISIPIIFCSKEKNLSYIPALFIYVGSTIAILLTKNLLYILFFLEMMMLTATFIIFIQKDAASKSVGLNYFTFHMLGGTLLLAGILSYYLKFNSFEVQIFNQNDFQSISAFLILLGLLVNLAIFPCSSWLLNGYAVVPSYISLVFAICTTKISALLILKLFAGWNILIIIGIFTSLYGILYSIFERDIKRTILYIILAELGIVLIFIGVGENIINTTLLAIINDLLCIPTLLCAGHLIAYFLKQEKPPKIKNKFNNIKLVIALTIIALFSIAAFPFTLGYISKQNLYSSNYFINNSWLSPIMDLISIGLTIAAYFRFIEFIFFKNFSFEYIAKSSSNQLTVKEYWSYIFALVILCIGLSGYNIYFISLFDKTFMVFDDFFLHQMQDILIAGMIFFLLRCCIYTRNIKLLDPNILYLDISKKIYQRYTPKLQGFYITIAEQLMYKTNHINRNIFSYCRNKTIITYSIGWTTLLAIMLFLIILCPLKWLS